jgi:hypothetical protein
LEAKEAAQMGLSPIIVVQEVIDGTNRHGNHSRPGVSIRTTGATSGSCRRQEEGQEGRTPRGHEGQEGHDALVKPEQGQQKMSNETRLIIRILIRGFKQIIGALEKVLKGQPINV